MAVFYLIKLANQYESLSNLESWEGVILHVYYFTTTVITSIIVKH